SPPGSSAPRAATTTARGRSSPAPPGCRRSGRPPRPPPWRTSGSPPTRPAAATGPSCAPPRGPPPPPARSPPAAPPGPPAGRRPWGGRSAGRGEALRPLLHPAAPPSRPPPDPAAAPPYRTAVPADDPVAEALVAHAETLADPTPTGERVCAAARAWDRALVDPALASLAADRAALLGAAPDGL